MFLNFELNSDIKSNNHIDPIKNQLISDNQYFQNVPKVKYEHYKETILEKPNHNHQNLHEVIHEVPYIPLPRFFVIKSVDEDNILKVIFCLK
jgi:hypothetical protein